MKGFYCSVTRNPTYSKSILYLEPQKYFSGLLKKVVFPEVALFRYDLIDLIQFLPKKQDQGGK
jgi:hypothetical protein